MGGREIEYTISLPATRLIGVEITDLEKMLLSDANSSSLTFKLVDESTIYTYDSATELLSDPTVPDFVREYSIILECEEGVLEIDSATEGIDDPIQLVITGAPEWARSKRAEVHDFFTVKQDKLRTFVEPNFRLELTAAAVFALAMYFLQWAGLGPRYGITSQSEINRIAFFVFIITFVSRPIFDRLYPYTLLILNPDKELHPFLGRLAYLIMLLAAIIAINSWLTT